MGLVYDKFKRLQNRQTLCLQPPCACGLCRQVSAGGLYPPKVAISRLVNSLKGGVPSRLIRKKHYAEIERPLWCGSLWSPSYFAGSAGGAPLSIIREYIEDVMDDMRKLKL